MYFFQGLRKRQRHLYKGTVPPSLPPCYMFPITEHVTDCGSVLTFRGNVIVQRGPGGPVPTVVPLMVLTTSFMTVM